MKTVSIDPGTGFALPGQFTVLNNHRVPIALWDTSTEGLLVAYMNDGSSLYVQLVESVEDPTATRVASRITVSVHVDLSTCHIRFVSSSVLIVACKDDVTAVGIDMIHSGSSRSLRMKYKTPLTPASSQSHQAQLAVDDSRSATWTDVSIIDAEYVLVARDKIGSSLYQISELAESGRALWTLPASPLSVLRSVCWMPALRRTLWCYTAGGSLSVYAIHERAGEHPDLLTSTHCLNQYAYLLPVGPKEVLAVYQNPDLHGIIGGLQHVTTASPTPDAAGGLYTERIGDLSVVRNGFSTHRVPLHAASSSSLLSHNPPITIAQQPSHTSSSSSSGSVLDLRGKVGSSTAAGDNVPSMFLLPREDDVTSEASGIADAATEIQCEDAVGDVYTFDGTSALRRTQSLSVCSHESLKVFPEGYTRSIIGKVAATATYRATLYARDRSKSHLFCCSPVTDESDRFNVEHIQAMVIPDAVDSEHTAVPFHVVGIVESGMSRPLPRPRVFVVCGRKAAKTQQSAEERAVSMAIPGKRLRSKYEMVIVAIDLDPPHMPSAASGNSSELKHCGLSCEWSTELSNGLPDGSKAEGEMLGEIAKMVAGLQRSLNEHMGEVKSKLQSLDSRVERLEKALL